MNEFTTESLIFIQIIASCAGFFILIVGVACFCRLDYFKKPLVNKTLSVVIMAAGAVITIVSLYNVTPAQIILDPKVAVSMDYKCYIDGVEVDPDNIDFSHYKVTIDEEQEKIMCSPE